MMRRLLPKQSQQMTQVNPGKAIGTSAWPHVGPMSAGCQGAGEACCIHSYLDLEWPQLRRSLSSRQRPLRWDVQLSLTTSRLSLDTSVRPSG